MIIADQGEKLDGELAGLQNDQNVRVLYEPLDIHAFKREVEALA